MVDGVVVAVLWLVLAGRVDGQELLVAVTTGIAAAVFGAHVRRQVGHTGAYPPGAARAIARAALGALTDTWTLTQALAARRRGEPTRSRVREVPFRVGGDDPGDVTRRVLATLTCSSHANTYLIGFDPDRDVALVHELVPTERAPIDDDLRDLG